jgi:two-component system, cell cycle response regulator
MSGRILIVDDLLPNLKLMEARLGAEYFDVTSAMSGKQALELCAREAFDVILLDVMMPEMDGFEVCRRIKADIHTAHIPVVMVTSLDQPADRVRGLEAGADDFLTKPIDDVALLARVRSLIRFKIVQDELRARALTSLALGQAVDVQPQDMRGSVLLVEDRPAVAAQLMNIISPQHKITHACNVEDANHFCAEQSFDVALVSLGLEGADGLRLLSHWRSHDSTKLMSLIMLAEVEDRTRVLRGLDFGVHDYITRPIDRGELLARVRTQIRRKRNDDLLRATIQNSIEASITDHLTGLHNRRFFERHMANLLAKARPLAMMILDIDHFKRVNDSYGHDVGDEVLKIFARRMDVVTRDMDLVCRLGGEEFVIIMPQTALAEAQIIAERVRVYVERQPFPIRDGADAIPVTVSIGLAQVDAEADVSVDDLFRRADQALYRAKQNGRNQVALAA